jgi:hypothetical protein
VKNPYKTKAKPYLVHPSPMAAHSAFSIRSCFPAPQGSGTHHRIVQMDVAFRIFKNALIGNQVGYEENAQQFVILQGVTSATVKMLSPGATYNLILVLPQ